MECPRAGSVGTRQFFSAPPFNSASTCIIKVLTVITQGTQLYRPTTVFLIEANPRYVSEIVDSNTVLLIQLVHEFLTPSRLQAFLKSTEVICASSFQGKYHYGHHKLESSSVYTRALVSQLE